MIYYKDGYKHQLHKRLVWQTNIYPEKKIKFTQYNCSITLTPGGLLTLDAGFVWDGASGPTWDSKKVKKPSAVHDALYKLMREKLLDRKWRKKVDKLFYRMLLENKFWFIRARIWYRGVRMGAKQASITGRKVIKAP